MTTPNTNIDDLPSHIQDELGQIVKIIKKATIDAKMVWLFGSFARGEQIDDVNVRPDGIVTEYHSDLDLLLVVKQEGTGGGRAKQRHKNEVLRALETRDVVKPRIHAIFVETKRFDEALGEGQFFYSDIVKEGRLLWDQGHPLVEPKNMDDPQLRRRLSEGYFHKYYKLAMSFRQGFEFYYQTGNYSIGLFTLHQMCEHLFHTMLLVYTNYKPRTHDLNGLGQDCGAVFPPIINAFHDVPYREMKSKTPNGCRGLFHVQSDPANDTPEQKLWRLLQAAYVDSRYEINFKVEPEEAEALGQKVERLQKVIHKACLEKVQSFLPDVPLQRPPLPQFLNMAQMEESPTTHAQLALQKQQAEEAVALAQEFQKLEERQRNAKEKALQREERERKEKEEALQRAEHERSEKEEALQREKKALQEKERLEQLLKAQGIDPNGLTS